MKTETVLRGLDVLQRFGEAGTEVRRICLDNRKVEKGDAFVCIKGFAADGHAFAESAAENGASLIVMQDPERFRQMREKYGERQDLCFVLCGNTRRAAAVLSDNLYGHPSGKLSLIGITGTKGKTTTSYMIKSIYDACGDRTGLIGTICNMIGERRIETDRTTPEANVLQALLAEMAEEQVKVCVMEASSQGLNLDRTYGCEFQIGIFTNLSPDHIGATEHKDMADYAQAKAKLFRMCRTGLVNADSPYASVMTENATCRVYTYGIDTECDFRAVNIQLRPDGVSYDVTGLCPDTHIEISIPGRFSVYNSLAAVAACYLGGKSMEKIAAGIRPVVVCGKAENVPTGRDFSVMIDYAHNPDSLTNILTTARAFAKRTVLLFGCGGDRNRPRALMGKTAGEYADFTIITSDNPRTEDPERIVRDIEEGIKGTGKPYICIVNRREAIEYAIANALPGDVIILAGKGHETYQIFKDKTIHFDEREVVREALRKYYGDGSGD